MAPEPPGGGQEFVLDLASFQANVLPVLTQYGCNAMACHGGGIRGTYQLSPVGAPDVAFDFAQTGLQVNPFDPAASPILAEPLASAAGGTTHQLEPFDSIDHPDYITILAWIESGDFE